MRQSQWGWPPPAQAWCPPPPPIVPVPPIVGVTDGSTAAPGEVGEVLRSQFNGSLTAANGWSQTFEALTLTPGDWDVWFNLIMTDIGPGNFNEISGQLSEPGTGLTQASVYGSWGQYGLGGGSLSSGQNCISTAVPLLLSGIVFVIVTGADTAGFNFLSTARRRR